MHDNHNNIHMYISIIAFSMNPCMGTPPLSVPPYPKGRTARIALRTSLKCKKILILRKVVKGKCYINWVDMQWSVGNLAYLENPGQLYIAPCIQLLQPFL